ncbi:MAG TPA: serine/threonine-protein kinase, partial [Bacillota bacterium]|nr:serine/threonine-protein kinase [Bacillota bacterium]
MAEPENSTGANRRCPRCGAELPPHLPPDLCPKCLLQQGLATPPPTGPGGTVVVSATADPAPALPRPGELFGHYRILRTLGGGGMGAVFEAEDLESGRRVALKVLSHTLDSLEARQRFLREGRLAASINHPNSVYVFGTEEIGGTPVIAMELVSGGTLEERVRAQGPLPPAEAVDAVLQIIGGLEAAQRIGILHRDVKPSNCFLDADGTVKIGDFGLSISTAIRTEPALTASGGFLGTPAFCSPEQLRGEELNARSDIYSLGATLFYLLTGRTPFEARNVVALIATVLEQPAPSPRQL